MGFLMEKSVIEIWMKPALRNLAGRPFTVADLDAEMCRTEPSRAPGDRAFYSRILRRLVANGKIRELKPGSGRNGATYLLDRYTTDIL
jgi:hypothetical protein